ncbi:MAG TPA: ATP-binding protein [Spirochaetota bacterium]|nr:ATP-binding protein [Spirochaetota bacterium]HPJ34336.1 ATP-binding protein [Spirochaetota bacterium]
MKIISKYMKKISTKNNFHYRNLLRIIILLILILTSVTAEKRFLSAKGLNANPESGITEIEQNPAKTTDVHSSSIYKSPILPDFTMGSLLKIYVPLLLIIILIALVYLSLKKQILKKNSDLKINEERFRLIFENSPVGIIHFDKNGIITACNSSLEKIIGSEREKILGLNMTTLPSLKVSQTIKHVLSGNTSSLDGIYNSSTAEKATPVRAIFAPLTGADRKIKGGIGIIEDITLWKMYEERLRFEREEAERANRTKSIFLANMSHEVRTPLNGILGLLQILKSSSSDKDQSEMINMAMKSGERLTRLLSDILDLTKIETEHFSLFEERLNIREFLDSIYSSMSNECTAKGLSLTCSVSDTVPELLMGDELRLRQIIQNLLENSVKFTSRGSIKVKVDFLFLSESGGELIINVTDTGIGIEQDRLREILEPFRQVENTYTRRFQGAGLGLAIVKKLVKIMNGEVEIRSTPGEGTEVRCIMKLGFFKNENNISSEQPDDKSAETESFNILLVEDDRVNSLMIHRLLEKKNHIITDASNGFEAIEQLNRSDFDLILMDIQMPEMNGLDAIREIRKKERFGKKSDVKVIALTAYAMAGDREKFLEEGFNEYITKPVDIEKLNSAILRLNIRANS